MRVEELRTQALEAVNRLPDEKLGALLDHIRALNDSRDLPKRPPDNGRPATFRQSESGPSMGLLKYRGIIHVGAGDIRDDIERARRAMAEEANEY